MLLEELGERASRRSIRHALLVLREKKVLRREFSGLREVLFVLAGLASRFIEWRAVTVLCTAPTVF